MEKGAIIIYSLFNITNFAVNSTADKKEANKNNDTKASKDSFEELFKKASNDVPKKAQFKKPSNVSKLKNKNENFVEESRKSNSATSSNNTKDVQSTKEVKNTKENQSSTKVEKEETKEDVKITEDETATTQNTTDKMMLELALLFGISKEEMQNTLETLNLDLTDLGDKENSLALAQAVFEKESPAQLLEIPNMKQILEQVSALAEQASTVEMPDAVTQVVPQQQEMPQRNETTEQTKENNIEQINGNNIEQTKEARNVPLQMVLPKDDKQVNEVADTIVQEPTEAAVASEVVVPVNAPSDSKENRDFFHDAQTDQTLDTEMNMWMNNPAVENEQTFEKVFAQKTGLDTTSPFVDGKNVIEQMVHRLKGEIRGNESIIRITLQPESLGDVHLKITSQNGIVTASFVAENEKIKAVIESNFHQLRDVLQEQGLEVQSLSVSVSQEDRHENQNSSEQGEKSSRRIQSIVSAEMDEEEAPEVRDALEDTQVNFIA